MTLFRLGIAAFLLFAASPAWAATLTVGQSTVTGGNITVAVPATLTVGAGEQIVAAQFDLSFDSTSMTLNDVTAGAAAVAAGKDLSFSFPDTGTARIIIAGFNQNVISSGILASISLSTLPAISIGSHLLACSELVLSDAQGNSVSAIAVSGVINAGGSVPNVVGLAQTAAQTALTSVGLVMGSVSLAFSNTVAAGLVISQSPTAATHVAYGAAVNLVASKGPQTVTVPSLAGLTQLQAQNALVTAGLVLGTVTSEFSDTVANGHVIRQTPASGNSAAAGSAVAVVLSKGPQIVTVPNVAGLTQAQAQSALVAAGLVLGTVTSEFSSNVTNGLVIRQSPASGDTAASGGAVAVVLSKGPQTVTVPSVTDMTRTEAESVLVASGLVLGAASSEFSDTVAVGLVIRQTPESGNSVISGSAVALVISKGPENVTVPNVVGITQAQAQDALVAAGLLLGTVTTAFSDTVAAGIVMEQAPSPGATVPSGNTIDVVLSKGPATVPVPNVVGMNQAQAQTALAALGLVLGTVTSEFSATVTAGLVLSQTPASATSVASGSAVALVLSKGPQTATVPSVVGATQTVAQNTLVASGLMLGAVTSEFSDSVAAGLVLSQTPAPGSMVSLGSAVAVVLSKGPQTATVPDLIGTAQTAAQYKLIAAGLALGNVTSRYSATVAAGVVIAQYPTVGTVLAPGAAVNLIVSSGASSTSAPSVLGMTQTDAQNAITTAGLVLGDVRHAYSDSVAAGLVISQTPDAATTATPGAGVSVVISDGPAPSGCIGGTAKALGQGPKSGNTLLLGAVLTLLSVFRRSKLVPA